MGSSATGKQRSVQTGAFVTLYLTTLSNLAQQFCSAPLERRGTLHVSQPRYRNIDAGWRAWTPCASADAGEGGTHPLVMRFDAPKELQLGFVLRISVVCHSDSEASSSLSSILSSHSLIFEDFNHCDPCDPCLFYTCDAEIVTKWISLV